MSEVEKWGAEVEKWGAKEDTNRKAEDVEIQRGIDKRAKAKQEAEAAEIRRATAEWEKFKYEAEADEIRNGPHRRAKAKREAEVAEILKKKDQRAEAKRRGEPPVDRRFKKGVSGNPRGRPPKRERSLTRRQLRRDILRIAEAPVTVKTDKGLVKVSAIEAIILRATSRALTGHGPSIRFVMNLYAEKIAEHDDLRDNKFSSLEDLEKILMHNPEEDRSYFARENLNYMRKLTRRT
jgi:hypothetical protein